MFYFVYQLKTDFIGKCEPFIIYTIKQTTNFVFAYFNIKYLYNISMDKVTFFLILYIIGIIFASGAIVGSFLIFYPLSYRESVINIAKEYDLPPVLIASVINAESGFNPRAVSSVGAVGLMQLMPDTAKFIAQKNGIVFSKNRLIEPEYNITLGTAYIKYLVDIFGDTDTALCAYNAGPTRVKEWLLDPEFSDGERLYSTPYKATNYYLTKIKQNITIYTKFY